MFRASYIPSLRILVSAAKQNHDGQAMPDEVDAISGTVMNAHFAHAVANRFDVSSEVFLHAHHTTDNQRLGLLIPRLGEPFAERLRLNNLHDATIVV